MCRVSASRSRACDEEARRRASGTDYPLSFCRTSSRRASLMLTRVGMPPPSSRSLTKSMPLSKAAASVIMPASRTMATGRALLSFEQQHRLVEGRLGVRAGVDEDGLAARLVQRGQARASRRPCDRSRRRPRRSRGRAALSFMPSTSQRTMRCLSPSSRKWARNALSIIAPVGPGAPMRVSTARASSSAPA